MAETMRIQRQNDHEVTIHSGSSPHPILHHPPLSQGEGTNFSFTAHTALHWTAAKGHASAVRWLLAAGASPSRVNASGSTALHAAADNKQLVCAQTLLLFGGADLTVSVLRQSGMAS